MLRDEAYRFEFFQAVRLIGLVASDVHGAIRPGVSVSQPAYDDQLRFRAQVGLGFPAAAVTSCTVPRSGADDEGHLPLMTVSFLGLAGPAGVLPWHYTQLLIDTVHDKDLRFRDFLDLFNHRAIAQFYRAWQKSHFYVGYEAARRTGTADADRFTRMLFGFVGMATPWLQRRQTIPDDVLLYYAGHFSHRPRSAVALEQMLGELLRVPTTVEQFRGQWLQLRAGDETRLAANGNNALGGSAIVGSRVWSIEHGLRIRLYVTRHAVFQQFLPGARGHVAVGDFVRSFVGPVCDFDLQIVLSRKEVPPCELTAAGTVQLGWNTWLFSEGATRDVDDAVFACDAAPSPVHRGRAA
jgi:type VI secretion system protein ImpH